MCRLLELQAHSPKVVANSSAFSASFNIRSVFKSVATPRTEATATLQSGTSSL